MTTATVPAQAHRASSDLRLLCRQVLFEQLGFWLNPIGATFTIGFALVFMVLLGLSEGNSRIPFLHNVTLIEYYVPSFAAYGVMMACFNLLSIGLVQRREAGLLKRLRLSPIPVWAFLGAALVSMLIIATIQVVVVVAVGRWGFGVALPHHYFALAATFVIGAFSFTAMGVAASTFIPNQDAAPAIVNVVFFVLLFISGVWFPLSPGSALARLSSWFPVRYFVNAVLGPFGMQGGRPTWVWHDLLVVAAWGVAAGIVAVRRFRWAPRRD